MAAVELALVLPLFLVMVFGMVEFSLMLYDKAVITNASREAARAGIVASSPKLTMGQIQTVATNYCSTSLISLGAAAVPTVTVTGAGGGLRHCAVGHGELCVQQHRCVVFFWIVQQHTQFNGHQRHEP